MHHHQLLEMEVEGITVVLEHLEVADTPADLDIPEVQDIPEDPDTLEDMDLTEINGTPESTRIPQAISSAT